MTASGVSCLTKAAASKSRSACAAAWLRARLRKLAALSDGAARATADICSRSAVPSPATGAPLVVATAPPARRLLGLSSAGSRLEEGSVTVMRPLLLRACRAVAATAASAAASAAVSARSATALASASARAAAAICAKRAAPTRLLGGRAGDARRAKPFLPVSGAAPTATGVVVAAMAAAVAASI